MTDYLSLDPLRENVLACRAYTRHYAKSFYFSSHVLPRAKRDAAYTVYAFCRYADNIVDTRNDGSIAVRLDELRTQLGYVYAHDERMHPMLIGLQHTIDTYTIPMQLFLDLITGVEMDMVKSRYETFQELHIYCHHVASVVGLIMSCIFGVSDSTAFRHAADLGTAMQLTNILRDVGEDARLGRIYLPQDELERFGIDEPMIESGVIDERWRAFMRFQIDRARRYYAHAREGIPMLSDDGSRFCVRLMHAVYAGILTAIERNDYDVFTVRAYVPTSRKALIALQHSVRHGYRSRNGRESFQSSTMPVHAVPVSPHARGAIGLHGALPRGTTLSATLGSDVL